MKWFIFRSANVYMVPRGYLSKVLCRNNTLHFLKNNINSYNATTYTSQLNVLHCSYKSQCNAFAETILGDGDVGRMVSINTLRCDLCYSVMHYTVICR